MTTHKLSPYIYVIENAYTRVLLDMRVRYFSTEAKAIEYQYRLHSQFPEWDTVITCVSGIRADVI